MLYFLFVCPGSNPPLHVQYTNKTLDTVYLSPTP